MPTDTGINIGFFNEGLRIAIRASFLLISFHLN